MAREGVEVGRSSGKGNPFVQGQNANACKQKKKIIKEGKCGPSPGVGIRLASGDRRVGLNTCANYGVSEGARTWRCDAEQDPEDYGHLASESLASDAGHKIRGGEVRMLPRVMVSLASLPSWKHG